MKSTILQLIKRMKTRESDNNPLDLLPNFQNYIYQFVTKPHNSKVEAWPKLEECERRFAMYQFVENYNDPKKAQHRILLDDVVNTFLLAFEATIQLLKHQYDNASNPTTFDKWLAAQKEYDIGFKGLRTLRHLKAHVELRPTQSKIVMIIGESLGDGTSDTSVSRTWHLPSLSQQDLQSKYPRPLKPVDLNDWNTMVTNSDVMTIFQNSLINLNKILLSAENYV